MSGTPTSAISVQGVHKRYVLGDTEVQALKGVSVDVQLGEFLSISGPSGSGKSTLLNILGLLDHPEEGELTIDGLTVNFGDTKQLERLRQEKLGFVFQNFNLIPVLTALENVELPLLISNLSAKARRRRAATLLDAVGLGDRMGHLPRQLSGGQQQRVAVARALATQPLVVLADEPTANLDTDTSCQLLDLMAKLNEVEGTTFVLATHDPRVMERAKRVLRLKDGEILQ